MKVNVSTKVLDFVIFLGLFAIGACLIIGAR